MTTAFCIAAALGAADVETGAAEAGAVSSAADATAPTSAVARYR
ncbi:hypothetical protein [Streptomyces sp. NPDC001135]